jgi:biopolymer transport protein ExbD
MGMGTSSGPNQVKSDINVTPLVDVVLVLLIIFLITMPVVMRTVTLEVPRKAEDTEETAAKPIIVTQRADGQVNFHDAIKDDRVISSLELTKELRTVLSQKSGEKVVFVDFCDGVPWQDVVSTMDRVRAVASPESAPIKDRRAAGGDIKVALKKKEKKSEMDPNKPDPCTR